MQMPTLRTLTELFTTKILSLNDPNFIKLSQSKSKSMRKVITDRGHWTDLSRKTKTKTLRTESMVLLAERRMGVWSWATVHLPRDTRSPGWRTDLTLIETATKGLQGCLAWLLQTDLKLHMFIQEIQIKEALYLNLLPWFTTPINTIMCNPG